MKISILSAVHNEELYLGEMIESVQAQSHSDWELLFVSDGSTDETTQIIAEYSMGDPRIRLVGTGTKVGKVAAFNFAYGASTGDLIVLLAGDDTLPPRSLETRAGTFSLTDPRREMAVAFFKLCTFSEDPSFSGMVLPKGTRGAAHSGGTITMTRALARRVFPISAHLVSEDLWLCHASEGLASRIVEDSHVVLNYRIHANNSNPRQLPYNEMASKMAVRHQAHNALLAERRFHLSEGKRQELQLLVHAEKLRASGKVSSLLLTRSLPIADRLAFASMSHPSLAAVRRRFYAALSGWRGR